MPVVEDEGSVSRITFGQTSALNVGWKADFSTPEDLLNKVEVFSEVKFELLIC